MKGKMRVSLCLIAKDEEEFILSCLNSAKHLVDEIIVVDTGSRDETAGAALAAGARVFNFSWTGDFAAARNFALERAGSDWILVLDADEVLAPVSVEEFGELLSAPGVEGYFLHVNNYLGAGNEVARDRVVRLFKNRPQYRFEGAIHEQVAPSILRANGGGGLAVAPLEIHHYGYLKEHASKKDRFGRNTAIIKRELEKKPGDPFLLYCLALEYYQKGKTAAGLACLEEALGRMKGSEGYFEDVIFNTALGLLKEGRTVRLIEFTGRSLKMFPEHPDLFLIRGMAYLAGGKYRQATGDLEKALRLGGSRILPGHSILCILGDARNLSGDFTRAEDAYLEALSRSPGNILPLTRIIGLLQRSRSAAGIDKISRFAAPRKKKLILEKLREAGEISLAAMVLLLSLYDAASRAIDGPGPAQLSAEFCDMLPRLAPLTARPSSFNYLSITAREIRTYAVMAEKGFDCGFFPAGNRLKFLVRDLLLLLAAEFCPQYSLGDFCFNTFDGQVMGKCPEKNGSS